MTNDKILVIGTHTSSLFNLTGRVAVIIGGTSGIGRTLALGLAEAGADAVATGRREEQVAQVAAEIQNLGRKSLIHPVDVSERSAIDAFRDATLTRFGRIDILVNAAGQTFRQPTHTVDEQRWNTLIDTNVTGILRTCQSFFEPLQSSGRGRVINVASLSSYAGFLEVAAYGTSKTAVLGFTRSLAVEWACHAITINAIAPGIFKTELNAALIESTDRGRELLARTPMKRFGHAAELIGAAVLLASDAASYITGQCITVDGGFLASGVNS